MSKKIKQSSRLRMGSRLKFGGQKQIPALTNKVDEKTGKFITVANRALRRKDVARLRRLGLVTK